VAIKIYKFGEEILYGNKIFEFRRTCDVAINI
jgi:hypothetical protein